MDFLVHTPWTMAFVFKSYGLQQKVYSTQDTSNMREGGEKKKKKKKKNFDLYMEC